MQTPSSYTHATPPGHRAFMPCGPTRDAPVRVASFQAASLQVVPVQLVSKRADPTTAAEEIVNGQDEGKSTGAAPRVLVVEDDVHIGRLVERILMREGYTVVRVMDVEGALDVLEAPETVDLLFTDVVLPGVRSGADLAAELRRRRPELPIILTTGYDQSRIADHPGLLDTVAFLPKPFTAVQVRDLVRQELGRG